MKLTERDCDTIFVGIMQSDWQAVTTKDFSKLKLTAGKVPMHLVTAMH